MANGRVGDKTRVEGRIGKGRPEHLAKKDGGKFGEGFLQPGQPGCHPAGVQVEKALLKPPDGNIGRYIRHIRYFTVIVGPASADQTQRQKY